MSQATLSILYATETGNAEELAERTAEKAREIGYTVSLSNVCEYDIKQLTEERLVLVIASTWGDGDPPEEAVEFSEALDDATLDLSGTSYCILALGDTDYTEFCGFGRKLDNDFKRLGARCILDRKDLDVDYEEDYEAWCTAFIDTLEAQK